MARELSTNNNNDYGGRFQKYDLSDKNLNNFGSVTFNLELFQTSHILGTDRQNRYFSGQLSEHNYSLSRPEPFERSKFFSFLSPSS